MTRRISLIVLLNKIIRDAEWDNVRYIENVFQMLVV